MFGKKKPEVLIVGAGPVGLFAAIALTKGGVPLRIVDKEWRRGARSDALALHAESLRLLADVGLLDPVLQQALPVDTIGLYEGHARRAEIRLGNLGDDSSCVAVVPQNVLEHVLEDALKSLGVTVRWNHKVSELAPHDHGAAVAIDKLGKESLGYAVAHTEWVVERTKQLEVPFVIGADGHHSTIRRMLGIDFPEAGPVQHFAMFECPSSTDLGSELRIVMDDQTTSCVWPLRGGYCRWNLELDDVSEPEASLDKDRIGVPGGRTHRSVLSADSLLALLSQRAPWFAGNLDEIKWRIVVRFEHRLVTAFGEGRIWLVGDAGHMTGPVGIQSMNVGLREARDLAAIVTGILRGEQSAEALDEYNRERMAEWKHLLEFEGGLDTSKDTDAWIFGRCSRLITCLPASGDRLASLAGQLNLTADSSGLD